MGFHEQYLLQRCILDDRLVGRQVPHPNRVFLDFVDGKHFLNPRIAYRWKAVGGQHGEITFGMVGNKLVGENPKLLPVAAVNHWCACRQGEAVDDTFVGLVKLFLAIAKVEDGLHGKVRGAFVHLVARREPHHIVEIHEFLDEVQLTHTCSFG